MQNTEPSGAIFDRLERVVRERLGAPASESYVASLNEAGVDKILKKVGEECAEVLIAAKNPDNVALIHELADLWFHVQVLMTHRDIHVSQLTAELARRMNSSGLEEKAARGGDK